MEVVHARCFGIDVHQASLAVCVTIKEGGKSDKHKLRCGTTTAELLRLANWLGGYQVTRVVMEATGVHWKPVRHILEGQFELLPANPTQVQALRPSLGGHKSLHGVSLQRVVGDVLHDFHGSLFHWEIGVPDPDGKLGLVCNIEQPD
jgi:hypothetical protein